MTDPIAYSESAPSEDLKSFSTLEFACERVFLTVLSIRSGDSSTDLDMTTLKGHMSTLLENLAKKAANQGESAEAIRTARYALVAFADETIATRLSDWNSVLAQKYFEDNRAGEGFFKKAKDILDKGERPDLARIYAMCLAFGFRGEYAVRNTEGLEEIQKKLADFGDNGQVNLSSLAVPQPQAYTREPTGLSPVWYAGIFACFALVFAISLSIRLDSRSEESVEWINAQAPAPGMNQKKQPKVAPASLVKSPGERP